MNNDKEVMVVKFLIISGSIIIPILMVILRKFWSKSRLLFHVLSLLSALIFGNLASLAILKIIEDHTVFMTNIHGLFLNPIFLLTGAYLGIYLIYSLLVKMFSDGS